ncbi:MAG: hypothetical protein K2O59_10505 [Lachnospiraceae bacterium]|nr:hypothetical protein [Lachnospiraceae bacterium]
MLPLVKECSTISASKNKLLIIAGGFETRTMAWLSNLDDAVMFEDAVICKYEPEKESKYLKVLELVKKHTKQEPSKLNYNRFEPTIFESKLRKLFSNINKYDDIYVDITVMSKLLIMIVINELRKYKNNLHIIYSEPVRWGPSEEEYKEAMSKRKNGGVICLSSVGVGDIVRTPALSSVVMQKNPVVLVAGLSFNEQIVNILVNDINPEKLFLINQGCQRDLWREDAIEKIHQSILDEYGYQKDVVSKYLLIEYDKVFEFLVKLYKRFWLTNRIILSPTGYKMHAVSFALMKILCPDIHIEYPTPESYLFDGYSDDEIKSIYELEFTDFEKCLSDLYEQYKLGG